MTIEQIASIHSSVLRAIAVEAYAKAHRKKVSDVGRKVADYVLLCNSQRTNRPNRPKGRSDR